jgi:phage nucleotide-binding protein
MQLIRANQINPKLKLMLYGKPGIGKTSLATGLHRHKLAGETLVLDVEDGSLSVSNTDVLLTPRIKKLSELDTHITNLVNKAEGYKDVGTVVLDSGSRMCEIVLAEVTAERLAKNPSNDPEATDIRDYQVLQKRFLARLQVLRDLPMNIIVTALTRESGPDATADRPSPTPNRIEPMFPPKLGEIARAMFDHVWAYGMKGHDRVAITDSFKPFQAKTRGPAFFQEITQFDEKTKMPHIVNPNLSEIYETLLKTQGPTS